MKKKLLAFIIIMCFCLSSAAVPAFAGDIIDITKPEGDMVSDKAVISICGICVYDETFIEVFYFDSKASEYKVLPTVDGDNVVKVGNGKIYAKNYELKSKGDNSIKIKAYTAKTKDKPQESLYTITVSEPKKKNWVDDIKDGVLNVVDFLKKL